MDHTWANYDTQVLADVLLSDDNNARNWRSLVRMTFNSWQPATEVLHVYAENPELQREGRLNASAAQLRDAVENALDDLMDELPDGDWRAYVFKELWQLDDDVDWRALAEAFLEGYG